MNEFTALVILVVAITMVLHLEIVYLYLRTNQMFDYTTNELSRKVEKVKRIEKRSIGEDPEELGICSSCGGRIYRELHTQNIIHACKEDCPIYIEATKNKTVGGEK